MSQHWPNNTAWLPQDGTHMVERRNEQPPSERLFLRAPKHPDELPMWTNERALAGVWSFVDAKHLAGIHSGVSQSGGGVVHSWAEPTDPADMRR